MSAERWKPQRLIEEQYARELKSLFSRWLYISDLDSIAAIKMAMRGFFNSAEFQSAAALLAERMVTRTRIAGQRNWRGAASEWGRSREIQAALSRELLGPVGSAISALILENSQLISTFAQESAEKVNRYIAEQSFEGKRAEAIAQELMQVYPDITRARLNLIARTESSKASTALTEARAEALGLQWYIWRTSKDARVRDAHRHMDGVLINWAQPPAPEELDGEGRSYGQYHAGNIFNCRCYPEPVVRLDAIHWPARVYWGGRITRMTRVQFEAIAGAGAMRRAA